MGGLAQKAVSRGGIKAGTWAEKGWAREGWRDPVQAGWGRSTRSGPRLRGLVPHGERMGVRGLVPHGGRMGVRLWNAGAAVGKERREWKEHQLANWFRGLDRTWHDRSGGSEGQI